MRFLLLSVALAACVTSAFGQREKPHEIYVKHFEVPPGYPPLARASRIQGTITMKLTIAADGKVSSIAIVGERNHKVLEEQAMAMVNQWTFGCSDCAAGGSYEQIVKFVYKLEGTSTPYRVTGDLPDEVTISAGYMIPQP
jgi:TonB family protein